jgi:hypothetical protein
LKQWDDILLSLQARIRALFILKRRINKWLLTRLNIVFSFRPLKNALLSFKTWSVMLLSLKAQINTMLNFKTRVRVRVGVYCDRDNPVST